MKNLANIINVEALKDELTINIERGCSTWDFIIPVSFMEFMSILFWELIYAMKPIKINEGLRVWRKEWDSEHHAWMFEFELLEDTWHGTGIVWISKDRVVFQPFNPNFCYEFQPKEEGLIMTFYGSRNAFAEQWIVPETIHDLWKEVDNDWSRADFMWDAKGDRFTQAEFLVFYAKVDAEEFPHH